MDAGRMKLFLLKPLGEVAVPTLSPFCGGSRSASEKNEASTQREVELKTGEGSKEGWLALLLSMSSFILKWFEFVFGHL